MRYKSIFSLSSIVILTTYSLATNAADLSIPNAFQSGTPALASEVNNNFSAVEMAVDDNNSRITALEATIVSLQQLVNDQAALITSLQTTTSTNTNAIASLNSSDGTQGSTISNLQSDVNTIKNSEVLALENYLTVDVLNDPRGPMIVLSGVNFQVNNGTGYTMGTLGGNPANANGLGNIIIGYDEIDDLAISTDVCSLGVYFNQIDCENNGYLWAKSHKSGSHNLIVGPYHSYSQSAGIVSGYANDITNDATAIIGGERNQAMGYGASVSGGVVNIASGRYSSVAGGQANEASNRAATIAGGSFNKASGSYATVSGGQSNTASSNYSTVSGGSNRTASGFLDWVAGSQFEDD